MFRWTVFKFEECAVSKFVGKRFSLAEYCNDLNKCILVRYGMNKYHWAESRNSTQMVLIDFHMATASWCSQLGNSSSTWSYVNSLVFMKNRYNAHITGSICATLRKKIGIQILARLNALSMFQIDFLAFALCFTLRSSIMPRNCAISLKSWSS